MRISLEKERALPQERLKELLDYDPQTGVFRWRPRRCGKMRPGQIAGGKNFRGYVYIAVDRRQYLAHRLAFLYMRGEFPDGEVDHKNLDKSDNRLDNLRVATHAQNGQNRSANSNSTAPYKGAYKHGPSWCSKISVSGRSIYLGTFPTAEEARQAYADAAAKYFGEFGRGD